MAINIQDNYFLEKAKSEKQRRGHRSLAKTVQELADERICEIVTGQYIPPVRLNNSSLRPTPTSETT